MLHTATRQATSLLLFSSYFLSVPAAFATLDTATANVVIALQALGLATVGIGMAIDRIFEWPDRWLVEGTASPFACPGCGCVVNSHAVWHIVALVSAIFTVVSREFALSHFD